MAEYTALQMKQAVAGHGKAAKAQVQEMVKRLLNLPGLPGEDAADALGLAITHAHAGQSMARASALGRRDARRRSTSGMYRRRPRRTDLARPAASDDQHGEEAEAPRSAST